MKILVSGCKYLLATFVVIAGLGFLNAAVEAQEHNPAVNPPADASAQYFALVIGNNAYQNIQRLKTAEDDAREVDATLRGQYAFQTKLLLNATRQQIISAINSYRRDLTPDANLLIYYAGHGINDREIDKAYWLPIDARLDDNSNWISADDITSNIKGIPAKHILIVSDSCYSGTLTRGLEASLPQPSERQRYLQKMSAGKSRTLMASGGNEPVADGGGGKHSIFANALLRGLAQMDKSQFTANELFRDFVEESVAGRASQTPEYNPLRNSGHESGDFIFARTGTAKKAPEPTGATSAAATAPASGAPVRAASVDPAAIELSFWESIKSSSDPQDFKAYLDKYPNGVFADLARRRAVVKSPNASAAVNSPTRNVPSGNAPAVNVPADNPAARDSTSSNPPNNMRRGRRGGGGGGAQPGKLRGIRDYFASVPERFLLVPPDMRDELLKRPDSIVDIKNGYISLHSNASDHYVMTVFRRTADTYLVAFSHTRPAVPATRTTPAMRAVSKLIFLNYDDEEWSDVTATSLPEPFDPNLRYELPRIGRTISVTNRAGAGLYDLVWMNGRFVVNR